MTAPLQSINPANGEVIAEYPAATREQIEDVLLRSQAAHLEWRETSFSDRARSLEQLAGKLEERKDELALLLTTEVGKPLRQSTTEIEKCAGVCRYYAERGEEHLRGRRIATEAVESRVQYEPLGPVLAVMPWNFPFWQVFRFAAPAVMAGNTGVLKHASNVPGSALAIEALFLSAGFPRGVFQTLLIRNSQVDALIDDPRIRAVTLTGSTNAGRAVGARAGRALKKCVLELGGSDPFVVLDDADVEAAALTAARARVINSGQSCIAAKRFIVTKSIRTRFLRAFEAALASLVTGDPRLLSTDVGPLARSDLRDELHAQVQKTIQEGGRLILGGSLLSGPGSFYPVTLIDRVLPDMTGAAEETFGPLAVVLTAHDEDDAIRIANTSRFGLGASIWTQDTSRAVRAARKIQAGSVFINGMVRSDPRIPFGGILESGFGRELSEEGIREFVNVKSVWIDRI